MNILRPHHTMDFFVVAVGGDDDAEFIAVQGEPLTALPGILRGCIRKYRKLGWQCAVTPSFHVPERSRTLFCEKTYESTSLAILEFYDAKITASQLDEALKHDLPYIIVPANGWSVQTPNNFLLISPLVRKLKRIEDYEGVHINLLLRLRAKGIDAHAVGLTKRSRDPLEFFEVSSAKVQGAQPLLAVRNMTIERMSHFSLLRG